MSVFLLKIAVIRIEGREAGNLCQAPGRGQNQDSSNSDHHKKNRIGEDSRIRFRFQRPNIFFRSDENRKEIEGHFFRLLVLNRNLRKVLSEHYLLPDLRPSSKSSVIDDVVGDWVSKSDRCHCLLVQSKRSSMRWSRSAYMYGQCGNDLFFL